MRVGITGHQELGDRAIESWVEERVRARLVACSGLYGLSSLAKGADQIFARVIFDLGGELEAVLPFPGYDRTFGDAESRVLFLDLLSRCAKVTTLKLMETKERSYLLAGQHISDRSELLVAVWNGRPAAGLGGTADIVAYARGSGRAIYHLNPLTREVSELR